MGGGPVNNMEGSFLTLEKWKISHFSNSKIFQKCWKIYNFLRILKENLRYFEKYYRNFREKLGKNLENFWNMGGFLEGSGAEPPDASENFKKLVEKSLETCKILKIFMKF